MKNIYFICPDMPTSSAGVLNIYKHALDLRKMGFNSYVVHFRSQFGKIN